MKGFHPNTLKLFTIVTILFSGMQSVFAQTGVLISTSPGTAVSSAMLEIRSSDKGLLLPRVNLVSLSDGNNPIAGATTGLLVYNLGGGGVPAVGLYYWSGTAWVQLTTGGFSGSGGANYITKWTASNAIGNSIMYESGTNVGIGTVNPLTNLHVSGTAMPAITITSSNYPTSYKTQLGTQSGAQGILIFGNNGVNEIRFGHTTVGGAGYVYVNNTLDYSSATDGTLAMTFANTGKVGIGTPSPAEKLDVNGAIKFNNTSSVCDATSRGTMKFVPGGVGVVDCIYQCMKRSDETYSWVVVKCPGISATGGSITNVGSYRIHTFTSSGTFTVTDGGNVEVLVVAGGGGGGWDVGGGGGGGGVIYNASYPVTAGNYTVSVGAGGSGASAGGGAAPNGANSIFATLVAIGGGGGGNWAGGSGAAGGSGGGATSNVSGGGGAATSGQGFPGGAAAGNSGNINEYSGASGGGGAGQAGGPGTSSGWSANSSTFGYGGNGLQYSISGTPTYYGGGGGSTSDNSSFWGKGGLGGGGSGNGQNATPNTGGGGGGAGLNGPNGGNIGGNGGSGIVIIRYQP